MWCDNLVSTEKFPSPVVLACVQAGSCWILHTTLHGDSSHFPLDAVAPRLDLPRAWTPNGQPVPGDCEYAVGHVVEYADGQKDCRPRYREDSRQSALRAAEDMKDDGYVAMRRFIIGWEEV